MSWLQVACEMHGAVEKNTLHWAQLINERGVYVIGKEENRIPSVENCLKLFVREKEGKAKAQF